MNHHQAFRLFCFLLACWRVLLGTAIPVSRNAIGPVRWAPWFSASLPLPWFPVLLRGVGCAVFSAMMFGLLSFLLRVRLSLSCTLAANRRRLHIVGSGT